MQALTTLDSLEIKMKESEETVRTLLQQVDTLTKLNQQQQASLEMIFKKMQCPSCTRYLDSKGAGDTVEGRKCDNVFLTRCIGIAQ